MVRVHPLVALEVPGRLATGMIAAAGEIAAA